MLQNILGATFILILMKSQWHVQFLKRLTQSYISYEGKVTIWIIRLEDCSVMFLYNHTLPMDAHRSTLPE